MSLLFNQAVQAHQSGRLPEAETLYRKIISDHPKNFDALHMLGVLCSNTGKFRDADKFFQAALSLDSGFAPCHVNYGFFLVSQRRHSEAIERFDRASALFPGLGEAWLGRGNALRGLGRYDEAFDAYKKAIALKPNLAEAHAGCGNMFAALKRYDEAIAAYDKALALRPDLEFVQGERLHCKMRICDWTNFNLDLRNITATARDNRINSQPFHFLGVSASAQSQLYCAKHWAAKKYPPSDAPLWRGDVYKHNVPRIVYISADFREHAVAFLIAGLIETHNKESFDVFGISLRPEEASETGQRIKHAFKQFIDVSAMTDQKAAQLIHDLEADIVVDLAGFTEQSRTGILAQRPAPIQVNYLGFPGTMGAPYVDYIIADPTVVPIQQQQFYSEKIVYLPDSFQANDRKRLVPGPTPPRSQLQLPENAFVFCCFNNNYKFTPDIFDSWMRILERADDSVLWLVAESEAVEKNLRKEAAARGIDGARLIYAPRVSYADHLARLSAANLFLDTAPFNAGATASDALWAGLPVLTRAGEVFASRMAASLLKAIGLPELATETSQAYEDVAVDLATSPEKAAAIKDRLGRNRMTAALFDTERFTRHLEAAYSEMYRRYHAGVPPDHIQVKQQATN